MLPVSPSASHRGRVEPGSSSKVQGFCFVLQVMGSCHGENALYNEIVPPWFDATLANKPAFDALTACIIRFELPYRHTERRRGLSP